MFNRSIEERLTIWKKLRDDSEHSQTPLEDIWEFWKNAPFIHYNHQIDPYHQKSWPTPWEIIVENKYDDFTKALMIAWTIKLVPKFTNSKIEIRTLVDENRTRQYNIVCINDKIVINFSDDGPVLFSDLPESLNLQNIILVNLPR